MLPNESLLQVLHFADYKTIVVFKLAAARFLCVVTKYAEELARRCIFQVDFFTTCIKYINVTDGVQEKCIHYERGNQTSLAAACRELDEVVGPRATISVLKFYGNTMNMAGVGVVFEAAPSLKYAEVVDLYSPIGSTIASNCEAFMHNFVGMKAIRLWCDCEVFRQFSWTFLSHEAAREVRFISVFIGDSAARGLTVSAWPSHPTAPNEKTNRSVEELVRYCITLPRLRGGETLELDFADNDFSGAFGLRIIEMLKSTRREVTFRMSILRDGELLLDESDYTVDVDDTTTRYASEESGIVVEVNGRSITIRRTAEIPRKKPRTSEETSAASDTLRPIM